MSNGDPSPLFETRFPEWVGMYNGVAVVPQKDYDALAARLREVERDLENARWLIANGERCFGTLWREAGSLDIYTARAADSAKDQESARHD